MNLSGFDSIKLLYSGEVSSNVVSSIMLLAAVFLARMTALRALGKIKGTSGSKLEWRSHIKMTANVILILGMFVVWGTELRTFALSLVAIAAAVVIATKELILCFMGGILKSFARPFKVGDRIEIDKYRGDVVEHNFLTTSLFEIGPGKNSHLHTGRKIVLPNSIFLSNGLFNETRKFRYRLHTFVVTLPHTVNLVHHKDALLAAANEICGGMAKQVQDYLDDMGEVDGIEAPNAIPRVSISFTSGTSVDLIVRIPIPALKSARTEQAVLQKYIEKRDNGPFS